MIVTDEMARAFVAKYREFYPGAGFPTLTDAKSLIAAALSKRPAGIFAGLSEEQQKKALEYRGDENHGDPSYKR